MCEFKKWFLLSSSEILIVRSTFQEGRKTDRERERETKVIKFKIQAYKEIKFITPLLYTYRRGEVPREWRKLHNEELNDLYFFCAPITAHEGPEGE